MRIEQDNQWWRTMASRNCFLKCIVERFLTKPMCWIRYVKCELNDAQRASIAVRNKFGKLVHNSYDKEWKYEKRWFSRTRTTIRTKYTRKWVLFWTTRKPKTRSRKRGAIRNSLGSDRSDVSKSQNDEIRAPKRQALFHATHMQNIIFYHCIVCVSII